MIKGNDNIERKPYLGSTEIAEVWLGDIKIYPDNVEPPTPGDYSSQYLTFEALEDGTFTFTPLNDNVVRYSLNNGRTWVNGNSIQVINGKKVLVKGELIPSSTLIGSGTFSSTGQFNVYGNIMSLLYGDNFIGEIDLTGYDAVFKNLFKDCNGLVNAENLILPATTLTYNCYSGMFYRCENLVTTPELPATTLANYCYGGMFQFCTSLVTAPELPATDLARYCYNYLFAGCTSLVNAPELPATKMEEYCYNRMFEDCTSLTTAPELPAIILANNCYYCMFLNCTSLNYIKCLALDITATDCTKNWVEGVSSQGEFVSRYSGWGTGRSGIPTGWTETESVNGYWTSLEEITGCAQKITSMRFVTDTAYDAAPIIAMDRFQFSNVCRYNAPELTWTFDDIEDYVDDEGTFTINFFEEIGYAINSADSDVRFNSLRRSAASNGVRIYWL